MNSKVLVSTKARTNFKTKALSSGDTKSQAERNSVHFLWLVCWFSLLDSNNGFVFCFKRFTK